MRTRVARPFLVAAIVATHLAVGVSAATAAAASGAPIGYYDTVDASSATELRATLHEVIDDHDRIPYTSSSRTDTWDVLEIADQDPTDAGQILDVYRNASYPKFGAGNNVYNREHAWPRSYGFPDNLVSSYPYSDAHALFLSNSSYNSTRSNKPYATCTADCAELVTEANAGIGGGSGLYPGNSNWTTGSGASGTWETWGERRGDVARALLYLDVRYEGDQHSTGIDEPDLVLTDDRSLITVFEANTTGVAYMGLLSVLLQWHAEDPVDDRERVRNDVVFAAQGNRNPFIDHPAWVACVFEASCGGVDTEAPALPDALSADPGDQLVALSWAPSPSADLATYTVHRSDDGVTWVALASTPPGVTTFTDDTVNNNTTYTYAVSAIDHSGNESPWTTPISATPSGTDSGPQPWINEFHYDNKGKDTGEFVEIAGPAGTDLNGWTLVGYNGANGEVYRTVALQGVLADQQNGFGTATVDLGAIQNGSPDGLALVDSEGRVVEFLSYEGDLLAMTGPAAGQTATDIGVSESGSNPKGRSLQRVGTGQRGADFSWQSPAIDSPGAPNAGQTFSNGGGGDDTTPPSTPTGLTAAAGRDQVLLSWDAVTASDLVGYHVLRWSNGASEPERMTTTPVAATVWIDFGASNGSSVTYAVIAVDSSGNESPASSSIAPPVAAFTVTVTDLDVTFTDASGDIDGAIASWSWDFGDGATSSAINPSHGYGFSGSYLVVLTVVDDTGSSASTSQTVTVGSVAVELTVVSMTPGRLAQNTTTDVTITGTGFADGATLSFVGGSGPAPTASGVVVVDGDTITATIRIKAGGPGKIRRWDVVVTNPDGTSAVLADGLVVEP